MSLRLRIVLFLSKLISNTFGNGYLLFVYQFSSDSFINFSKLPIFNSALYLFYPSRVFFRGTYNYLIAAILIINKFITFYFPVYQTQKGHALAISVAKSILAMKVYWCL